MKTKPKAIASAITWLACFAATGWTDEPPKPRAEPPQRTAMVTCEMRALEMSRETADSLFGGAWDLGKAITVNDDTLKKIVDQMAQKGIVVIAQPKLTTVSGTQADVKSAREQIYPTQYTPATATTSGGGTVSGGAVAIVPATPGGFTTREVGVLLNLQPTVSEDRKLISIVIVPEVNIALPDAKWEQEAGGHNLSPITQPIFRTWRITTTVLMKNGSTILLGVLDPMLDEPKEPRDRVVLFLLTAAAAD